jgi:hypothetical protein
MEAALPWIDLAWSPPPESSAEIAKDRRLLAILNSSVAETRLLIAETETIIASSREAIALLNRLQQHLFSASDTTSRSI